MRVMSTILVAAAAITAVEYMGVGTPAAGLQIAHAEQLSSSLQFKVKKLATRIADLRARLGANGQAAFAGKQDQWQGQIDNFANALTKFPDVDDPHLTKAKADLALLQGEFAAAAGIPAPTGAVSALTAAQRSELKSLIESATKAHTGSNLLRPDTIIAGYAELNRLKASLATYPKVFDADLNAASDAIAALEQRLRSSSATSFSHLVSASDDLEKGRRALTALTKSADPSPLQERPMREASIARYNKTREIVALFENVNDPRVAEAKERIGAFAAAFKAEMARAKTQVDAIGDIDQKLAELTTQVEATAEAAPVPTALDAPFSPEKVKLWAEYAAKARKTAEANIVAINRATRAIYNPEAFEPLVAAEKARIAQIATNAKPIISHILRDAPVNPDVSQSLTPFIDSGDKAGAYALLDDTAAAIKAAMVFQQSIGADITRQERLLKRLEIARADFQKAFKNGRLPEPKSTDPDLIAAAKDILARPKYGFGAHGPIVLTTPGVTEREKEESKTTYTDASVTGTEITLTGTKETWHYKWQEFRFATPIQNTDGSWNIWWITAKKFSSHWDDKLVGRWISSKTVEGNPIPESRFRN